MEMSAWSIEWTTTHNVNQHINNQYEEQWNKRNERCPNRQCQATAWATKQWLYCCCSSVVYNINFQSKYAYVLLRNIGWQCLVCLSLHNVHADNTVLFLCFFLLFCYWKNFEHKWYTLVKLSSLLQLVNIEQKKKKNHKITKDIITRDSAQIHNMLIWIHNQWFFVKKWIQNRNITIMTTFWTKYTK